MSAAIKLDATGLSTFPGALQLDKIPMLFRRV